MSRALLARQASVGYQVNHLARLLAQALRERVEPLGVVPGQFAQLLALYEQDGLTQAELCARVRIEQPTMANTLARPQRDGLIDRVPDPADGRRALVMLTSRARDLQDQLIAAARAVNTTATRGLDEPQTTAFLAALASAIDNLDPTHDHPPEKPMTSTTIATGTDLAALINVFTTTPEAAKPLVDLLVEATEQVMRHRPGFVSAAIHVSLDGTRVVNYAQWSSREDIQAMLDDPTAQQHMKAVGDLAPADPRLYQVAAVHHA